MNQQHAYYDADTGTVVVSDVDPDLVGGLIPEINGRNSAVGRALARWAEDEGTAEHRNRLFERERFVTPSKVFEQMAMAYDALDDDIVGNVADTSEAIAFQKVNFECDDTDQEDVWSQIGRDLDLDGFVRAAWRELFTCSQFVAVSWWGTKEYKVRGKGEKRARRLTYKLRVPVSLGFLDSTRIVPVKNDLFGGHRLAWLATTEQIKQYDDENDLLVRALFDGKYTPTEAEKSALTREDIDTDKLMLLNDKLVWRHTLTKSPYERWAKIRMKSIFPVLDLKALLRQMDRAWLNGGINFIVLVTRGSDDIPTTRQEVLETTAHFRTQSRSPVIVSDHRIKIEIITPEVEHVLNQDKWAVLDERIMMRLWGTFQLPSETSNRETSVTLGRVIARGLASRRHMVKRSIEKNLIRRVLDDPMNMAADFTADTKIEFSPRRMELEFDQVVATVIQELRDRGDLSRETVLSEFNFDQKLEHRRREIEAERYDEEFKPVNVPFDSPNKTTPGGAGRTGGRPAGKPTNPQPIREQ